MGRNKRTDDDWKQIIRDCKSSGLSDAEWLKANHIASSTFYKKLEELFGEVEENTLLPEKKLSEIPESHEIVQLTFEEPRSAVESVHLKPMETSVVLKTGNFTIEISNNAGAEVIKNTILALQALC